MYTFACYPASALFERFYFKRYIDFNTYVFLQFVRSKVKKSP